MLKHPKFYYVICISSYEIDGVKVDKGEIGQISWGRPIMQPNRWRKMTDNEVDDFKSKKKLQIK